MSIDADLGAGLIDETEARRRREEISRYADFYAGHPFTRVVAQTPSTKLASKTNLCLVNVGAQDGKVVVTAALDNLVKGASGQGVECFNIAFGLDRTAGLEMPPQWP